jgi:Protein of unknown function (DUF551)
MKIHSGLRTMTTVQDVIAETLHGRMFMSATEAQSSADEILAAIISAPEPVRLELAALLNPWRPIETAPKDEMFIYYWPRDGKRCIGLAYRTVSGDWRDSEGNWHIRLEPTHWFPLPAPPSEDKT